MVHDDHKYCVPDLQKERDNCPFDKEEITNFFDGGKDKTILRRTLEKHFLSDPDLKDKLSPDYLSHEDRYANELRKAVTIVRKLNEDENVQQLAGEMEGIRMLMGSGLGAAINKDGNPLAVHYAMFLPALMGHGTLEQQSLWMSRAWVGQIIGTYAQTELGHGTFLRGLETTATYDENTEEFVLHSPKISSYKWWPGGLGKTANYAIVMAQLYTKGKRHGPHPFIVQLRDEETHESLPGISVGEIGPRLGLNTNDNGFLGFNQHRIPRLHMLMRFSQVLPDGTYVQPPNEKLAYGTMVFVRVAICFDNARQLQRAVTIATRYAAVRHQSELVPGQPEPQILDYQTQQYKLLPHIASCYAMIFASRSIWETYNEVTGNIQQGNLDTLPELHALSCGLKALCAIDSHVGVDICRLACGGHGYLASSNLPRIWTGSTAAVTYEGENTVMWLQVARYIMKAVNQSNFSANSSLHYLGNAKSEVTGDLSNEGLLRKFQKSVSFYILETATRLDKLVKSGLMYEHALNQCSVALMKCAEAHIRCFTCEKFHTDVKKMSNELSHPTLVLFQRLCRLYLLYTMHLNQGLFLRSGAISATQLSVLENEMYELLAVLRPQAVSIVDAFDIEDEILNSTLGAYDGNVYQRLFDEAQKSPLNQKDVPDAFHKYLKPLMQSKL